MSELVEFLLARLAEDEAMARPWGSISPGVTQRLLGEAEAKRRIVAYLQGLEADRHRDQERHVRWLSVRWVAEQMATVYRDHPDYREEWV